MLKIFSTIPLRLLLGSAAILSLMLFVCGCDQIAGTPVVQVIGEVTMGRKPLADTMVAFIPLEFRGANGNIIEIAFGKTDDAGRFELRTNQARGVLPGEYRVLFYRAQADAADSTQSAGTAEEIPSDYSATGITSDTSLMLAKIDQFDSSANSPEEGSAPLNIGGIPFLYNVDSGLRHTVKPGAGIIYPKFNLQPHPKN